MVSTTRHRISNPLQFQVFHACPDSAVCTTPCQSRLFSLPVAVPDSKAAPTLRLKAVHLTQIGAACMGPNTSTKLSTPPKEIADVVATTGARWVPGLRALSPLCRPKHVRHTNTVGKTCAQDISSSNSHTQSSSMAASAATEASNQPQAFTFCELFAGIGGFRVGLEQLGGRCVFASEIDREARFAYTV